ncbi:MAG: zinc metallopeptidase [Clostridia bacterium]|nr:zinc metallopeptidase [Clostridia bacterium]
MHYGLYLILLFIVLALSIFADVGTRITYSKYQKTLTKYNGLDTARLILNGNQIYGIAVVPVGGTLTDNYSSRNQTVSLSQEVYSNPSISSVCIAAHELGHVLQDRKGFKFLEWRHKLVPVTNIANYASYILLFLGYAFDSLAFFRLGVIVFSVLVLYELITLPVEFNASYQAVAQIRRHRILTEEELKLGKKVLFFAALTYLSAFLSTLLSFLRLLLQLILSSKRRDDD